MAKEPTEIRFWAITHADLVDFLSKAESLLDGRTEPTHSVDMQFNEPGIECLARALARNSHPRPLLSILRIATKRYHCFALVEFPYLDLEEWESYSVFYSRCFTPYERVCYRVHLFEAQDKQNEDAVIRSLLDGLIRNGVLQHDVEKWFESELRVAYQGFFVLRPQESFVVGRTVIKFDESLSEARQDLDRHPLEKVGHPFCTTKIDNELHLSCLSLAVKTAPAIQQNPVVGVCATASVWVTSQILSARFGLRKYPYNRITRQASSNADLTAQRVLMEETNDWKLGRGLTVNEIKQAMGCTGCLVSEYRPDVREGVLDQARMRLIAYTFVESGVPVIACYYGPNGGHAVTLVGHLLPSGVEVDGESDVAECDADRIYVPSKEEGKDQTNHKPIVRSERHLLLGTAVQLYYAHNDAYGPFDRLQFLSDRKAETAKKALIDQYENIRKGSCVVARGRKGDDYNFLGALLIGLPPYVQNGPCEIIGNAMTKFDALWPQLQDSRFRVLWRCFLASAPDFKQSVIRREMCDDIRSGYLSLHLPLFLWVVEFTVCWADRPIEYSTSRKISGEFLYDATTPFYSPYCLTLRYRGNLYDLRTRQMLVSTDQDDVKYFVPVETRS